ncbi:MAG: TauD/TfdA family dioxygenase [Parvularculales bacterium]
MALKKIDIEPLSSAMGATITGVDLSDNLDNETVDDIHQALLDNHVIFFRDQTLTPERHKMFGRHFGSLNIHPYVKGMADHEEVMEIIKEPEEKVNFGGGWHSDMSFLEEPAMGSILYAVETPPIGGDTLFANQHLAYETLSDGMKDMLGGLVAIHTAGEEYSRKGHSAQQRVSMDVKQIDEAPTYEHPVVRTHPQTGRKALYVNRGFTIRFKNMTRAESKPLLDYLYKHSTREPFTCRFRWQPGSIAFWDNRSVQHYALNDYHGHRRHMRRVTINGDRPF